MKIIKLIFALILISLFVSCSIFKSKANTHIHNEDKKYQEIKKKMSKYQKFIRDNFNYVGENFA
jgi:peptidoglycan hydrolase CwlO-like protein